MEKTVEKILEVSPCTVGEVLGFLAALTRPKTDTSAGLCTVQDLCGSSQAFKLTDHGHTVAAYTVDPQEFDRGVCLMVTSLAGHLDGVDLALTMDRIITAQAQQIGAKQIAMLTRRRGLIRKLAAQGWTVAAIKMVKKI